MHYNRKQLKRSGNHLLDMGNKTMARTHNDLWDLLIASSGFITSLLILFSIVWS